MRVWDWLWDRLRRGDDEERTTDYGLRTTTDEDPFAGETDFPVTDELDLHGLPPKMVREIVEAYLEEARRLGYRDVRIVHGKGIGAQREHVRKILSRTEFVEAFGDAPHDRGGWGATVARLRPAE